MPIPRARSVACAAVLFALAGCEHLFSLDGDPELCARKPPSEAVTDELVILRVVESSGPHERLVLDRVRYLGTEFDQRYPNRVILATTENVRLAGQGITGVQRGDTLRISSTFTEHVRGGGYEAYIDNWAANEGRCWDGGWVSKHSLQSLVRLAD
jgi:hypothetical protein